MNEAAVCDLLQQRTGMSAEALGLSMVRSAIAARMSRLGLNDGYRYAERLSADAAELQALIDTIVVPETWFFRGGQLFYYLAERIRLATMGRGGDWGRAFRVLSIPCSTGEEPYSLALALCEADIPPARCRIDGIDISPRNIDLARRGIYGELSFRQTEPTWRQHHFRAEEGGWRLNDLPRSYVQFRTGNLLEPGLLSQERPYDLIFCRNVFIYFTPTSRQQALETLLGRLTADGLLCLGHADTLDAQERRLERTGPDGCFLYRRAATEPGCQVGLNRGALALPSRPPPAPARSLARPDVPPPISDRKLPTQGESLNHARHLADDGRLDEAEQACRGHLARFGPAADVYSLRGVIAQTRGQAEEAIGHFQKALYLAPEHREALLHLLMLHQQRGDTAQVALLRRRLERTTTR